MMEIIVGEKIGIKLGLLTSNQNEELVTELREAVECIKLYTSLKYSLTPILHVCLLAFCTRLYNADTKWHHTHVQRSRNFWVFVL